MMAELFLIIVISIALYILWFMIIRRIRQIGMLTFVYKEPLIVFIAVVGTAIMVLLVLVPLAVMVVEG